MGKDARNSMAVSSALRFSACLYIVLVLAFFALVPLLVFIGIFETSQLQSVRVFSHRDTFIDEALYPGVCR